MCKFTPVLLCAAAIFAVMAYVLYTPLPPEDFKQPIRVSLELASMKLLDVAAELAETFGYQYVAVNRAMTNIVLLLLGSNTDNSVQYSDRKFNGVPVRVYVPVGKQDRSRAVLFFHGGGFALGNIELYNPLLHSAAKELNAVAVSVGYRLAPEHLFPAAVDDSETATEYFINHASEFGVDPYRIAVMGDSAGGNLATVVALRLVRKHFSPLPKLQVLLYPFVQMLDFDLPSFQYNHDRDLLITPARAVEFTNLYLFGNNSYNEDLTTNSHLSTDFRKTISHIFDFNRLPDDEIKRNYRKKPSKDSNIWEDVKDKFTDPDSSPILAEDQDLALMPTMYVSTCQYDILRDEQLIYIDRVRKAGVKVIHDHLRACFHSWAVLHQSTFSEEFSNVLSIVSQNL